MNANYHGHGNGMGNNYHGHGSGGSMVYPGGYHPGMGMEEGMGGMEGGHGGSSGGSGCEPVSPVPNGVP